VPPLEAWEKVLIDGQTFPTSVHGWIPCIDCHKGINAPDKETAHSGLVSDPSENALLACGRCHTDIARQQETSLHYTLRGYDSVLAARSAPEHHPALEEMQSYHCDSCHSTCGQCHVSQPASVGGGLLSGHEFVSTPPMTRTCTACHGSRVGDEYLGKHEGLLADVHFRQGRMACVACHDAQAMHGGDQASDAGEAPAADRYSGPQSPACTQCHTLVGAPTDTVIHHTLHGDKLACQVCHSVEYTSCDGCHVQRNEQGQPYFTVEDHSLTFLIGLNPLQGPERPYEYVLLRHVPIADTSFAYYGEGLLSSFNTLPTWKYATPHNIQRNTPQTAACDACHGNADIFLTADKIAPQELEANQSVIIHQIPESR
jgi:hypothetical protein